MDTVKNRFQAQGKFRKAASELTAPENSGLRLILNPIDIAAELKGDINLLLAKKWKKSRDEAKGWYASRNNFKLGEIQTVAVQSDVWVINVLVTDDKAVPLTSFDKAMKKTADLAKSERATVHISDLMYSMENFEALAQKHFIDNGINVYVYTTKTTDK